MITIGTPILNLRLFKLIWDKNTFDKTVADICIKKATAAGKNDIVQFILDEMKGHEIDQQ